MEFTSPTHKSTSPGLVGWWFFWSCLTSPAIRGHRYFKDTFWCNISSKLIETSDPWMFQQRRYQLKYEVILNLFTRHPPPPPLPHSSNPPLPSQGPHGPSTLYVRHSSERCCLVMHDFIKIHLVLTWHIWSWPGTSGPDLAHLVLTWHIWFIPPLHTNPDVKSTQIRACDMPDQVISILHCTGLHLMRHI